jgi:glycosyltransferase involved in cell wall biosynthesis
MRIWAFPAAYPYNYPGLTSSSVFAHRQYKALQKLGAEIKVVQPVVWHPGGILSNLFPDWKQARGLNYPKKRTYEGLEVFHPRIANMKPGRIFKKSYPERYADAVINFFKEQKIKPDPQNDIFLSQWIPDSAMAQAVAKRLGIKSAVLIIGDDVLVFPRASPGNFDVFRRTIEEADGRFAVADYLARDAEQLLGGNVKIETFRRGVNYNDFRPVSPEERLQRRREFGLPEDKLVILVIGSPILRKGWLDLFDALRQIKPNVPDFVIGGVYPGHQELNIEEEVAKRGLSDNFINIAEIAPQHINRVYNAADIFCLPSHWEGIANCVVEAMSSGLPVVTTDVCGHPEVLCVLGTGILVPAKSPEILAAQLQSLLKDEQLRKQMGSSARKFITTEWGSFTDNAAHLYARLQQILEGK